MAALELNNGMVYGRNSLLSRVNLKRKINGFMIFCITWTTQVELKNTFSKKKKKKKVELVNEWKWM